MKNKPELSRSEVAKMFGEDTTEYKYIDGQYIDTTTGHIVQTEEMRKTAEDDVKNQFEKFLITLGDIGETTDLRLVKSKTGRQYACVAIKKDHLFTKTFRVDGRDMISTTKLSLDARGFLYTFEHYIHFPSNTIVIKGDHPTIEEMATMCLVKPRKLGYILKELEEHKIIIRKKEHNRTVIYLNPFLICSGGVIDIDTYVMFEDNIYNPDIIKNKKIN